MEITMSIGFVAAKGCPRADRPGGAVGTAVRPCEERSDEMKRKGWGNDKKARCPDRAGRG